MRYWLLVVIFIPLLALGHTDGGYTLIFNGTSAFVDVEDRSIDLSADFTVEC